jgi:hypothetical protein
MLGDTDDVATTDFGNGDVLGVGRVEINVIGADAGRHAELQVLGLLDQVGGEVAGVEGGRDEDVRGLNLLLEHAVGLRTSSGYINRTGRSLLLPCRRSRQARGRPP